MNSTDQKERDIGSKFISMNRILPESTNPAGQNLFRVSKITLEQRSGWEHAKPNIKIKI